MKLINISVIIFYIALIFVGLTNCYKKSSINSMPKSDKVKIGKKFKKYQLGQLNYIPDGPITDKQLDDYMNAEQAKGGSKNVGVVYIDPRIADLPVGQTRIKAKNMFLYYPPDFDARKYQNSIDQDKFVRDKQLSRITLERDLLNQANDDPTINPFKEIYDKESEFLDYESDVNKDAHKKNLLNLAVEKEEEILNSELNMENSEYFDKKINKGFYNKVYDFRNKWANDHPEPKKEDLNIPNDPQNFIPDNLEPPLPEQFSKPENQALLATYSLPN
jgi:hypothetical protein